VLKIWNLKLKYKIDYENHIKNKTINIYYGTFRRTKNSI